MIESKRKFLKSTTVTVVSLISRNPKIATAVIIPGTRVTPSII